MPKASLNHAAIGAWLRSPEMAAAMLSEAEPVLSRAVAGAPVESGESGEYRDSLRVWVDVQPSRVVARVGSDVPHAGRVEAATGNLARALG